MEYYRRQGKYFIKFLRGTIKCGSLSFTVSEVLESEGEIRHFGEFNSDQTFSMDDVVQLEIDAEVRKRYARRHSAAHILDNGKKKYSEIIFFYLSYGDGRI